MTNSVSVLKDDGHLVPRSVPTVIASQPMIVPTTHRLENGDRLDRADFESLCDQQQVENAELIHGVVRMNAAALRFRQHGEPHSYWFLLRNSRYEKQWIDPRGLLRSEVFPGLILDTVAMLNGDIKAVLAALPRIF